MILNCFVGSYFDVLQIAYMLHIPNVLQTMILILKIQILTYFIFNAYIIIFESNLIKHYSLAGQNIFKIYCMQCLI
jgi:hypothetical protein